MRNLSIITTLVVIASLATCSPFASQHPSRPSLDATSGDISIKLFAELEELSRIVDISYCVGTTGISKPFKCASRCDEFPDFELVATFNTGPLMSDSCGYIVLDHSTRHDGRGRVIIAFRGTYSIANTIVDLSTVPQEYVPYPDNPDNETDPTQPPSLPRDHHRHRFLDLIPRPSWLRSKSGPESLDKGNVTCNNCTVHTGFWTSWQNTRPFILPHISNLREKYPDYQLHLVGHSLGGAVAALAALEFEGMGYNPTVTTFGEPRVGNSGLRNWIDWTFSLPSKHLNGGNTPLHAGRYRRITHVDDPVPLLPLQEWGYRAHAGELYISKSSLQPSISDIRLCFGDDDVNCIAGAEVDESWFDTVSAEGILDITTSMELLEGEAMIQRRWGIPIPARYKIWQLFFAHRDYFWRLGLCVPGGDPLDWGRERYDFGNEDGDKDERVEEL
jgi:hypothetical protein